MPTAALLSLVVYRVTREAQGINSYDLRAIDGSSLPSFTPGAHIDVHLPNGLVRQYSLCNAPSDTSRYVIAVLKDPRSRGGSRAVHENLTAGSVVEVSLPRNNFQLSASARHHLLVAGGIGVTPLLSMSRALRESGASYFLHYCCRDPQLAAFRVELEAEAGAGRASIHYDGGLLAQQLDLGGLLAEPPDGTHLYYCGPQGFMRACASASQHWAPDTVHFEHFGAPPPSAAVSEAGSFEVRLARSGRVLNIPSERSIADVLEECGLGVMTSCRAGLCGTCRVAYLEGTVDHRDLILSPGERATSLTTCVSRSAGGPLVLDL